MILLITRTVDDFVVCTSFLDVFFHIKISSSLCMIKVHVIINFRLCLFSQNCPPVSPNMATTPNFDNFTITITDSDPVLVTDCQYQQPISVEKVYDITITINNEVGSSEPTTVMFGELIIIIIGK